MKLSNYKEDINKRESGTPCYIEEGYFDVVRFNTAESAKQIEDIKIKLYGFAPKDMDMNLVLAHWLVDHGVTGWGGIIEEGVSGLDVEIEYSKQKAMQIFLNPEYFLSLNLLLINHASDYSNYLYDSAKSDIEEIKKK